MKKYNKPSIKYVELRAEEGLADIGSSTMSILGNNNSKAEQISSNNWFAFWLKVLRK